MSAAHAVPPPQRRRTARDLSRAVTLRPRDVFELYGISASTIGALARHPDPARRPPSRMIKGRGGRKGMRLFNRAEFEAWLARWDSEGEFAASAPTPPRKAA